MCLLMHRLRGASALSAGWLADFWQKNSDGFGAWWVDPDTKALVVRKTLVKGEVEAIVREIEALDVEAGLHWRWATHGALDESNVHPFTLTADKAGAPTTVAGHNGVLSHWAPNNDKNGDYTERERWTGPNDTVIFVERCLRPMVQAFGAKAVFDPASPAHDVLSLLIGSGNRLLLTGVKLGFQRIGSGWVEWNGKHLSNQYAWSYAQRDKEAGPVPDVPFVYRSSQAQSVWEKAWDEGRPTPGSLWQKAKEQGVFGAASAPETESSLPKSPSGGGGQSDGEHVNGSASKDGQSQSFLDIGGSLLALTGLPKMLYSPPNDNCPVWHWRYLDAAGKPSADVPDKVLRDPVVGPVIAAAQVKYAKVVTVEPTNPQKAQPRDAAGRFRPRKLCEQDWEDLRSELIGLNAGDDVALQVLNELSFADLCRFCSEEPEEAALLIQSFSGAAWEDT